MRQLADIIAGKEAVLVRLRAELANAQRMHRAADAFSPAERWYGNQVTSLSAAIGQVNAELRTLRDGVFA